VIDIAAGRLSAATLARNFSDAHPPLTAPQSVVEADRCHHCYDAPCIEACPTGIDIPGFIGRIATGDLGGAAEAILDQNILGGACARVCPTDILCEGVCVRVKQGERAVSIGALQRTAVDWQMAQGQPYRRAPARGTRIAVVGAGPAGLACAHRLSLRGHDVDLYDARPKPGGLNEYGIAAYKVPDDFAQNEVAFVLEIGGITWYGDRVLGQNLSLETLRETYDAVFLGIGQSGVRALGLAGEDADGVFDAVDFIETLRQSPPAAVPIGVRVVVIGGGNTAIDAAVQARRLGADDVTLVYRRGPENMSATPEEQEWALQNLVTIRHWATPAAIETEAGHVTGVRFARGAPDETGKPVYDRGELTIPADMVLKAVGQLYEDPIDGTLALSGGRILVDARGETSLPGVFAGGDCTAGEDLTVAAVRDGRDAAEAIDTMLTERGR
jgi:dihydropyrimidine dehydrogenase (NAD+) subunit PreT